MTCKFLFTNLILSTALVGAQSAGPRMFATPEAARDALVQAAREGLDAVRALMGPESVDILRTGDEVQDKRVLERFNQQVKEKTQLAPDPVIANRIILLVGKEDWPFAVPLQKKDGQWYWDVKEGKQEIRYRTIGGDELDAIEICRGYVDAQEMYAGQDWNKVGIREYARRIASSPGKKDGLYWAGDDSPVAQTFAKAAMDGYPPPNGSPKPFHGYMYKILTAQGPSAVDGAREYIVHNLMIGGFGLVAWPAVYSVSGIKTFIVNQDGIVYEKDLGPKTGAVAKAMTTFNPDSTWEVSP